MKSVFCGMALVAGFTTFADAQELGNWSLGQSASRDGVITYSASLRSTNLITSGSGPDYAPLYSIACKSGADKNWQQWLELEDAVYSRGDIELLATVDDKRPREEIWHISSHGRLLTRENLPDIAELTRAHMLKLSWNWGWSWLWLSDEARLELGDIEPVIFTLAKSCGIAEPE